MATNAGLTGESGDTTAQIAGIGTLGTALDVGGASTPGDTAVNVMLKMSRAFPKEAVDFCLKKAGIKTIHYVSPSIWAWRKNRVKKIKKSVDKMLCILPFEPLIYERHKIPAKYIGHPLAETIPYNLNKENIRDGLRVKTSILVAILPGSRVYEIR